MTFEITIKLRRVPHHHKDYRNHSHGSLSETCSASKLRSNCDRAKGHSKVGQLRFTCEQRCSRHRRVKTTVKGHAYGRSANAGTSAGRGAEAARLFAHSYSLRLLTGPKRFLPLPLFFLLPTQPTPKSCHYQLKTPLYKTQHPTPFNARPHSGSDLKSTKNPRHSDQAGSLCIRPAALNDSQFRTLPSCNPFVYCEDLVATNLQTTEQLHVVD
ncbi:hypothetical protein E4T47_01562 [Aureobasidium subglaciale]|nr:hypothetical protein E4T47_01562 [Aureobasidium subglaciale]